MTRSPSNPLSLLNTPPGAIGDDFSSVYTPTKTRENADPALNVLRQLSNIISPPSNTNTEASIRNTLQDAKKLKEINAKLSPENLPRKVVDDPHGTLKEHIALADVCQDYLQRSIGILEKALEVPDYPVKLAEEAAAQRQELEDLVTKSARMEAETTQLKEQVQKEVKLAAQYREELRVFQNEKLMRDLNSTKDGFMSSMSVKTVMIPLVLFFSLVVFTIIRGVEDEPHRFGV
ncbi:hypothetical protein DFS34DRAFT_152463 [Phlyctochytrium arcticum]|nr:hypothetical protein DFS34DRAFT_152463 [Phlyctochytrium arcticum]